MKFKITFLLGLFFVLLSSAHAQKVIRLYEGAAPGSETWTHKEKEYFSPIWNTQVVTNVVHPTLTVYLPDAKTATQTGVIICPGGGFHALSINSEGIDVARWLSSRGIAAFVLKYRLVPTGEDGVKEFMEKMNKGQRFDTDPAISMGIADGIAAVAYVRKHAEEFGIAANRIGIMGFSAGGTVTAAVAFQYSKDSRPDFVAPIYPYMGAVKPAEVPADAPPLFVLAATDDQLGLAPHSVQLYGKWTAAKKTAEIHLYSKGGHGFGMRKQNIPSDRWIERFGEWLQVQGLMKPLH
ncbi:MAG: alpha/beta hydrolase [Acidobacteriota bacterium]